MDKSSVPMPLMAVRDKQSVTFLEGPFNKGYKGARIEGFHIENPISPLSFNDNGTRFAVSTTSGIHVYDCNPVRCGDSYSNKMKLVHTIPYTTARFVEMSPLGNFIVSYETYSRNVPTNHIVWSVDTKDPVLKLTQKMDLSVSSHPLIQWTSNEQYCFVMGTNEVRVYDGHDPEKFLARVRLTKLNAFLVSPMTKEGYFNVAIFSPVHGTNAPAKVLIYKVHEIVQGKTLLPPPPPPSPADIACGKVKPGQFSPEPKSVPLTHTAMLSFFKASETVMQWHGLGHALLARTSNEDTNGDSYYGESRLYLLMANNSFSCTVSFGSNKGTIHDVKWCPRGFEFMTLQGEARYAKATVWSAKDCTATKELGAGPWNMIKYSPNGRLLVLAGFGSLAGSVEVWEKDKLVRLAQFHDHDSPRFLEWSPCGNFFMTATCFPWLRVDNSFKVYNISGQVMYKEVPNTHVVTEEPHFHQVCFRPAAADVYPDKHVDTAVLEKAQRVMKTVAAPKAAAKQYVPPHLRGKGGAATSSLMATKPSTGPRDLVKEKKKGGNIGDVGGAAAIDNSSAHVTQTKDDSGPMWR